VLGACAVGWGLWVVRTFFLRTELYRATDMSELAPIAEARTSSGRRVLLYTGGAPEYNYQNQFLWYANRYSDLFTRLDYVRARLESGENSVAIMDRPSFLDFKMANADLPAE